jgi:hypothetical protein
MVSWTSSKLPLLAKRKKSSLCRHRRLINIHVPMYVQHGEQNCTAAASWQPQRLIEGLLSYIDRSLFVLPLYKLSRIIESEQNILHTLTLLSVWYIHDVTLLDLSVRLHVTLHLLCQKAGVRTFPVGEAIKSVRHAHIITSTVFPWCATSFSVHRII